MKTNSLRATLTALALLALPARAAEFYPKAISLRTFGVNQGNVGDCQTAADVNALESAFASRGLGFVKLSLHYRHAANWVDQKRDGDLMLDLDQADIDFIHRAGPLLPDFMWPEDGEGYDPSATGLRPHPARAVVWDPEFPSAAAMGFSSAGYTFAPGYSNSSSLDGIKANVSAGNAVVLSLHGWLFQPGDERFDWDPVTGFLDSTYSWANLLDRLRSNGQDPATGISHAVTVVGYDDSLYAGQYPTPGALIIRNSWNDGAMIDATFTHPTPEQAAALPKMRLKVFSKNLPGFYALPYQYVIDMQANRVGNFKVLNLDYAAFAAKYAALSGRYHAERLPYVCDLDLPGGRHLSDPARRAVIQFGKAFQALGDPQAADGARANASRFTYAMALREQQNRNLVSDPRKQPLFRYAKLSRHDGLKVDRADDFYAGRFAAYYCPSMPGQWPGTAQLNQDVRDTVAGLGDGGDFTNWYQFLRALSAAGN